MVSLQKILKVLILLATKPLCFAENLNDSMRDGLKSTLFYVLPNILE